MSAQIIYGIVAILLLFLAILLQVKCHLLNDKSTANPRPYSFARLQLVWWTFIVFAAFLTLFIATGKIPTFNESTLVLLGIGVLTTAGSKIIDISNAQNASSNNTSLALSVNQPSEGLLLDILSDNDGVNVHRLQAFLFNLIFGIWFVYQCIKHLQGIGDCSSIDTISGVMPVIETKNLVLMGLSSGAYTALKTMENK